MSDHMNLFEPYSRKEPHHEDALTRAFLLVLRGVPVAHAAWLDLVDRAHRDNKGNGVPSLYQLPEPEVETQTATVPEDVERIVSVVQTDEEYFREGRASRSSRRQVLDGLVVYGATFGIVIENKPHHANIREEQLDVNLPDGPDHDDRVACVTWKGIVAAWGALLRAAHLGCAERLLVEDFLDYVEEHFPHLRPYSTVALCGEDTGRLRRRCEAILKQLAPKHVDYHRGWSYFIELPDGQCAKKIALFPAGAGSAPDLVLEFDPGDTVNQARLMFSQIAWPEIASLLAEKRWVGRPSFHLMYITTGFFRPKTKLDTEEYWRRWLARVPLIRQWRRAEFAQAFQTLVEMGVVDEDDRAEFDRTATNTRRANVAFAPGFVIQWRIPIAEAAALDDRGHLVGEIQRAIERGANAFQLKVPW